MIRKKYNYKLIIILHILVASLITSLFWNKTSSFWFPLDKGCFQMVNSWIANSYFWQNFWAMANHRLADWVQDVCFLVFFFWIIQSTPKEGRVKKTAECIFVLLYSALTILFVNELLFRALLHVQRKSPTLILDTFTNLSEKITWLKVKTKSPKSFPGDHATTAVLFIVGFIYLARKNLTIAITATCYGIFLILPRMIAGAHWLTDVLFGSGSIVCIFFTWAFCTPFASFCIGKLEKMLTFSKKPYKKETLATSK